MKPQVIPTQKSLFANICEKISNVNLFHAVLMPAILGILMIMVGIFLEAKGEAALLKLGSEAYLKYQYSLQAGDTFFEYVCHSLLWQHNSFGGNQQGIGYALLALAPITVMVVFACRTYQMIQIPQELKPFVR